MVFSLYLFIYLYLDTEVTVPPKGTSFMKTGKCKKGRKVSSYRDLSIHPTSILSDHHKDTIFFFAFTPNKAYLNSWRLIMEHLKKSNVCACVFANVQTLDPDKMEMWKFICLFHDTDVNLCFSGLLNTLKVGCLTID